MIDTAPAHRSQAEKWRAKQGLTDPVPVTRLSLVRQRANALIADNKAAAAAAEAHRATDPVEVAKRVLQQRGRVVYRASVAGGPADLWVCSGMAGFVDDAALIAAADKVSGGGDRIAAQKRENAMKTLNSAETERLTDRGTTKSRVLDDLAQVVTAAGTTPAAARRLGLSVQLLYNVKSQQQAISPALLAALYGNAGSTLRTGLLDAAALPATATPAAPAPAAPATLAETAARDEVAPEPDDGAPADAERPDDDFTDVGAALERQRDAQPAEPVRLEEAVREAALDLAPPVAAPIARPIDFAAVTGATKPEDNATISAAEPIDWKTAAIAALDARRQQVVAERDAARAIAEAREAALAELDNAAAVLIAVAA